MQREFEGEGEGDGEHQSAAPHCPSRRLTQQGSDSLALLGAALGSHPNLISLSRSASLSLILWCALYPLRTSIETRFPSLMMMMPAPSPSSIVAGKQPLRA